MDFWKKLSQFRFTLLMLATAYGGLVGRTSGGLSVINDTFGVSPQVYSVILILASIVWTYRVVRNMRVDGITLTPLLLYYTMATYAIAQSPMAPTAPVAAYVFIATEIIRMMFQQGESSGSRDHNSSRHWDDRDF